jgi:hypothetical protein
MTCDLKMTLAVAAEKKVKPLADQVRRLTKQLDTLRQREISETEAFTKAVDDVARWKSAAGNYLSEGPGAFGKFQTGLKRALGCEETLKETLVLFKRDLIPHAEQELLAAREKLAQVFTSTVASARSDCEVELSRLMDGVVACHDDFLTAIRELGATFGTASCGEPPKIYCERLGEIPYVLIGRRWLKLKAPPIPGPAAPVAPAPCLAAVVLDVPKAAEHCSTVAECSTRDATPLTPDARRAQVLLRRSPPATETPLDVPPVEPMPEATPVDPGPPDPDPLPPDTPGPDPLPLDVDAEAPSEAEKENL